MLCFYIFKRIIERQKPTEIQNDKELILTSLNACVEGNSSTFQKMFFKCVHNTCLGGNSTVQLPNGMLLGRQN